MATFNRSWSDEQRLRLQELWNSGLSAYSIYLTGEFPGKTKNSICGEVWRLRNKGFDMRGDAPVVKKKPRKKRRFRLPGSPGVHRAPKPPTPEPVVPPPPGAVGLPLVELDVAGCRFVIDSDDTRKPVHLYCGRDASAFAPHGDPGPNCYCAYHQRVMRGAGAVR